MYSVLPKLTQQDQETGLRHFVDDLPLLWHPSADEPFNKDVDVFFQQYRDSLKYDRQVLLIVINVQMWLLKWWVLEVLVLDQP